MKLLITLSRVPYPLDKGDKLRAFYFIKYLSKYFDIVLFCVSSEKIHPNAEDSLKQFCCEIYFYRLNKIMIFFNLIKAFFKGLPLQSGYFFSCGAKRKLNKCIEEFKPDYIFCQLVRMAEYVKDIKLPKMLDYQDTFSYGLKRRMDKSGFLKRKLLKIEFERMLQYENRVFEYFEKKIIISETDRELIPHHLKEQIHVVSNGVDTSYYKPANCQKEYDIMFSGNMGYPPNIDAVMYLVNEILPIVKKYKKSIKVLIAGTSPTEAIKRLACQNVVITGWVEDMREFYSKSRVFIAPMRIGIGLQNKLLEAMAMGLPCITTPLANNALNASNRLEILVGNSKHELATAILELLDDIDFAEKISKNSLNFVKNNYSWEQNIVRLINIIENKYVNKKN